MVTATSTISNHLFLLISRKMDDSSNGSLSELRSLFEDYIVAISVRQHHRVSDLGSKICIRLVELFDEQLQEKPEDISLASENDKSISKIIGEVCENIREQGKLAEAYYNVAEFVRIQDLICLSKLVGAIKNEASQPALDYEALKRILRQSIYLLRYMNKHNQKVSNQSDFWLQEEAIERKTSIGFPVHLIDLRKSVSIPRTRWETFCNQFKTEKYVEEYDDNRLIEFLQSDETVEFIRRISVKPYPIDRFTVLVAIWIIAIECNHGQLNHLVADLIDQVYHEETNSANLEELKQLTQVGSFWLSYYKIHKTSFKQASGGIQDNESIEESSDEENSFSSISSLQIQVTNKESGSNNKTDPKMSLRRIVDKELLYGTQCQLCNYIPTEPLEPLNYTCPTCQNEPYELCFGSFQPISVIRLNSLLNKQPKLERLVMVSANEWIRPLVMLQLARMSELNLKSQSERVEEQVDITETFERLIVVRKSNSPNASNSISSLDSSSSDDDSDIGCRESRYSRSVLESFMKNRTREPGNGASESLRMIRFVKEDCSLLQLCAIDMLLLDSMNGVVKLCIASTNKLYANGSLWSCLLRSSVSQLMLGCGRIYTSLELIRLAHLSGLSNDATCPSCNCPLGELKNLAAHF